MQDVIEREILVKASQDKVYKAITEPEQIVKWFPDTVTEGTLEVGQNPVFTFTKYNHKAKIHVEAARPFEYFAYRWVPGGAGTANSNAKQITTLVEFFIEKMEDGTKIKLKESGFASLPAEIAEKSLKDNTGGWGSMMTRLEQLLNQN